MEAIGAQIKFHTLAVHELRKVLLLAGPKGAVPLLEVVGDMEDRYEGFIYPPKPREHGDPTTVTSGAYRSRRVAQDPADRLDKLLDGIRP